MIELKFLTFISREMIDSFDLSFRGKVADLGYIYAFGALFFVGSYLVPARFATVKGLSFFSFMGIGMVVVDCLLYPRLIALWAHPWWFWSAVLSGVLWAAGQALANLALDDISLAKASVFFNVNSLINIGIGLVVFQEASGLRSYLFLLAGGLLLFAGAWWVSRANADSSREGNLKKGILFSLLAGTFWGIYFAPVKALQVWHPEPSLSSVDVFAGLTLGGIAPALIFSLLNKKKDWTFRNVGLGVGTALVWAGGMIGFLMAIEGLGLSRAVPIVNSSALVYALWSLFVFKELPLSQGPKVLGGALLAVSGIILMALSHY